MKTTLLISLLLLTACSEDSSDAGIQDANAGCESVSCEDAAGFSRGTCAVVNDAPFCYCDDGYIRPEDDDTSCVEG